MSDENTNPGAQAPRLAPPLDSTTGTISLSPKNLALAALLFLGGAGGGGIGSGILGGDVKSEVTEIKEQVREVALDVVEIKSDLRAERRSEEQMQDAIKDHEERIRALEQNP